MLSIGQRLRSLKQAPNPKRRRRLVLLLVVSIILIKYFIFPGFPARGRVIDIDTKLPLANVWVEQEWAGQAFCVPTLGPHGFCNPTPCIASALARTDSLGQFELPRPSRISAGRYLIVAPGYSAFAMGYTVERLEGADNDFLNSVFGYTREFTVLMRKRTPSRPLELRMLYEHLAPTGCRQEASNFKEMQSALFRQLADMNVTPEQFGDEVMNEAQKQAAIAASKSPNAKRDFLTLVATYREYLESGRK